MASPVVYVQALLNRETSAGKITLSGEVFCAILTSFGFQAANAFYQIRICHIYILAGMGFLVTRLSHLHHIFALACYFPVNPLRCICSRSNSAGARGLIPPSAHAWPIK